MGIKDYVMGWQAPVRKQRYADYLAGKLDCNEIAILYQDMVESNCLPANLVDQAMHFVQVGLVRIPDQMPYN